jgi:hypothetical protein
MFYFIGCQKFPDKKYLVFQQGGKSLSVDKLLHYKLYNRFYLLNNPSPTRMNPFASPTIILAGRGASPRGSMAEHVTRKPIWMFFTSPLKSI